MGNLEDEQNDEDAAAAAAGTVVDDDSPALPLFGSICHARPQLFGDTGDWDLGTVDWDLGTVD